MSENLQLSIEARIMRTTQQVSCELADEVVILSLANGEYYGLNPVAARIWGLLQDPRTLGEIRDVLLAEYEGICLEACEAEIRALLGELVALDLVIVQ